MQTLRDFSLLIGRLAFGVLMMAHGIHRFFILGMDSQVAYLTQFNVPVPVVFATGAVVLEILGGFLLTIGWMTPLVALAFVIEMAMIIAWTNYWRGPWVADNGWEFQAILAAFALMLAGTGAGRFSVDGALAGRKKTKSADTTGDLTY